MGTIDARWVRYRAFKVTPRRPREQCPATHMAGNLCLGLSDVLMMTDLIARALPSNQRYPWAQCCPHAVLVLPWPTPWRYNFQRGLSCGEMSVTLYRHLCECICSASRHQGDWLVRQRVFRSSCSVFVDGQL